MSKIVAKVTNAADVGAVEVRAPIGIQSVGIAGITGATGAD
jgi:hypothetical protein